MRAESLERARSKDAGEVESRCMNLVLEFDMLRLLVVREIQLTRKGQKDDILHYHYKLLK